MPRSAWFLRLSLAGPIGRLRHCARYLGRVMRDIRRKIAGDPDRQAAFAQPLLLA
jgi:hypothetical protein